MNNDNLNKDANLIADSNKTEMQKIGRFILKSVLARGSFGTVYLAFDPQTRKDVVLKLIKLSDSLSEYWQQLNREFWAINNKISHQSIPKIISLGIYEKNASRINICQVTEYVAGQTLEESITCGLPTDPGQLMKQFSKVAEALDMMHSEGLVHSDLKPANLVLDSAGQLSLLDVGGSILRFCFNKFDTEGNESSIIGTPAFLAPEQIKHKHADAKSDLFSFAAVVFNILTGHLPFDGNSYIELSQSILNQQHKSASILNPDLNNQIDSVFNKALAKEPEKRYSTVSQFMFALIAVLDLNKTAGQRLTAPTIVIEPVPEKKSELANYQKASSSESRSDLLSVGISESVSSEKKTSSKSIRSIPSSVPLSGLGKKTFTYLGVLLTIILLIGLVLAIYPRKTALVLEEDPNQAEVERLYQGAFNNNKAALSVTASIDLTENAVIPTTVPATSEAADLIKRISNSQETDIIINELLSKLQSLPYAHKEAAFTELFQHKNFLVKVSAIKTIIEHKSLDYLPQIRLCLKDMDPLVRGFAVKALGILGDLSDKDLLMKYSAAEKQPEIKKAMENAIKRLQISSTQQQQ